ncbi:MAG: L,D-transpeptidase [Anaerolineae bacterium]|nr:L,D-transpeptidase [Anaerolineae bacterium]
MNTIDRLQLQQISRREFLQLAAAGMLALLFSPKTTFASAGQLNPAIQIPRLGRVLVNNLKLYERPSLKSKAIKTYYKDLIHPIMGVTLGDDEPLYNRIWYNVNDEGYVHSGGMQPVEVRTNTPEQSMPAKQILAEVTVPYTEAFWGASVWSRVAYRLYFGTTHWVTGVSIDKQGKTWYEVLDDKYFSYYYVNAEHLHWITVDDLAPLAPDVEPKVKRIEIRLNDQMLIAYEEDTPVFMTRTATGAKFSDGDFRTRPGRYYCNRKRPSRHMAAGDRAAPKSYDLPGVPWVSYLTESGVAIHGTYWHNDFGQPRSHGCINVSNEASAWLYRWSTPAVPTGEYYYEEKTGTPVDILY